MAANGRLILHTGSQICPAWEGVPQLQAPQMPMRPLSRRRLIMKQLILPLGTACPQAWQR